MTLPAFLRGWCGGQLSRRRLA